ncbi:MAG: tyrosine-protein phosphatase [Planctomycetes bacterium]|nr:tyrosine-protein phosphatase [Planctomycetota bacterium]
MIGLAAGVARKMVWNNFHTVEPGRAWRVARGGLSDDRLTRILRARGIRTVIDLRNPASSATDMADFDFAALGVRFESVHLRASVLAPPSVVARFLDLVTGTGGPFLFVCKRGKDKTGFASALHRTVVCGDSVARAWESQLRFVPFGHRPETHTGPWQFRALFERSGARSLEHWARHAYPAAYERAVAYEAPPIAHLPQVVATSAA